MHSKLNFKKKQHSNVRRPQYEDDIALSGRKGGKVNRERQESHQIDLELRNLTYR